TDKGGSSASTSATINVTGAASAVSFTAFTPPSASEGVATGTFTVAAIKDTNANPNINNLTATVTWGDGTTDTLTAAGGGIVGSGNSYSVLDGHPYAEEAGNLTFSVRVTDSAGGNSSTSASINVADAALTIQSLTPPANAVAGIPTGTLTVATFADANG